MQITSEGETQVAWGQTWCLLSYVTNKIKKHLLHPHLNSCELQQTSATDRRNWIYFKSSFLENSRRGEWKNLNHLMLTMTSLKKVTISSDVIDEVEVLEATQLSNGIVCFATLPRRWVVLELFHDIHGGIRRETVYILSNGGGKQYSVSKLKVASDRWLEIIPSMANDHHGRQTFINF